MKLSSDEYFQIGDLAKAVGVTTRTIRLYEQMGLTAPPQRTEGNIRVYTKPDIKRLKFVLKLKELGLTLQEMQELAQMYKEKQEVPETIMPRLVELLDFHMNSIKEKVQRLQSLEKEISGYREKILSYYPTVK
ncbi:MAG: MerR family transcriptional regulator [Desulfuromonadales bacterium]|nr:MerR family transcriptional regulator [Desulfuromonadales bacterium]